jgi:transposase-like protein
MTTRDIQAHMTEIYGVDVSPAMISTITDKVMPLVHEWQSPLLSKLYTLLYLDGIHFKIRDTGRIVNKCCYTVLGVTNEGKREILGLWINETNQKPPLSGGFLCMARWRGRLRVSSSASPDSRFFAAALR